MSIKLIKPIKRFWRGLTGRMRMVVLLSLTCAFILLGVGIYLLARPAADSGEGVQLLFSPGIERAEISEVLCHTVSGEEYTVRGSDYPYEGEDGEPVTLGRFHVVTSDGKIHSGLSLNSTQLSSFVVGTGKNYVYSAVVSKPAVGDADYEKKLAEYEKKYTEFGFSDESAFYEIKTEDGRRHRVYYGIKDVTGDGYYVRLEGDSTIYSTKNAFIGDLLQKTGPESLIESTLFFPSQNSYAYAFPYRYSIRDYVRVEEAGRVIAKEDYAVGYTVLEEDGTRYTGSVAFEAYQGESASSRLRREKGIEFFAGKSIGECKQTFTFTYPDTEDMGDQRGKTVSLYIETIDYVTEASMRLEAEYLTTLDRDLSHKLSAYGFTAPDDMTSYIPDSDALLTMLQNTMELSGTVVKLGLDDETITKYGLYHHQIWFSYPIAAQFAVLNENGTEDERFKHDADDTEEEKTRKDQEEEQAFFADSGNFLEMRLYVSDVTENGTRYVASILYDIVVEVEASVLDFMDQSPIATVDDFMITAQLTDVKEFQMFWNYGDAKWMSGGYTFEVVLVDVVTGNSGLVDENGNQIGGQKTKQAVKLIATPVGGGDPIVLELPRDDKGDPQPYEPYYQLYSRLTYSHYRGEHGLTDEELAAVLADPDKCVLRIVQLLSDGASNQWELYPISADRVLVRVKNGKEASFGAHFVIYGTALTDIARCYQRMMEGDMTSYEDRYK